LGARVGEAAPARKFQRGPARTPVAELTMDDMYNLQRFVDAQNAVYADVLQELTDGRKRTHWMWFVFPQIRGLGSSSTAQLFSISSLKEAEAYMRHPVLGERLREATLLVNRVNGRSVEDIFGYPDYLKFRSSMSLFARATHDNEAFVEALRKYFDGEPDPDTLRLL
jgi:uncharacterized protein (DUF1810 family)